MRVTSTSFHRLLFPSFTYQTSSPCLHLTFDDGPHPVATPIALDVLRSRNVKATFFLLGKNVESFPLIAKRILEEGHSLGNHSYDHPLLFCRSKRFVADQISRTENAIVAATSVKPTMFRPPYGFIDYWSAKIIKQLGYEVILWSTDPADFQNTKVQILADRIVATAQPGSIILMHDNESTMNKIGDLLDAVLGNLIQKGFQFDALSS